MPRALHFCENARRPASARLHHDLDPVHRLRTTRARASRAGAGADAGGARVLRLAGAALRARRLGRFAPARRRSRPPDPASASDAVRVAGPAHRHLRAGRRRVRGSVPRAAPRVARPAAHRARGRIGHQHPRRTVARQRRRRLARGGGRQPAHPGRPRHGPRAGQSGAAGKPGVLRGDRERRCTHRRDPPHDAGRRGVPRAARRTQPAADRALRGRTRRRRDAPPSTRSLRASSRSTSRPSAASPRAGGPRSRPSGTCSRSSPTAPVLARRRPGRPCTWAGCR